RARARPRARRTAAPVPRTGAPPTAAPPTGTPPPAAPPGTPRAGPATAGPTAPPARAASPARSPAAADSDPPRAAGPGPGHAGGAGDPHGHRPLRHGPQVRAGLQVQAGRILGALEPVRGHRVQVALPHQHVGHAPHLHLGTVLRVEQYPVTGLH